MSRVISRLISICVLATDQSLISAISPHIDDLDCLEPIDPRGRDNLRFTCIYLGFTVERCAIMSMVVMCNDSVITWYDRRRYRLSDASLDMGYDINGIEY